MKVSLSSRLLKILMTMLLVSGGITICSSYLDAEEEIQELFDAELARSARLLLSLSQAGFDKVNLSELQLYLQENKLQENLITEGDELSPGHLYEKKILFQIFDAEQKLILRSDNAPLVAIMDKLNGYFDVELNGSRWRTFSVWNRLMEYKVVVAESYEVRSELLDNIMLRLVVPYLVLLPVLLLLLRWAISQGLKPLKVVTDEVSKLDERHLTDLDIEFVPEEIQPLITALDRLFERLRSSFDKERRFSADAAHELRTPLAALRTHVQLMRADEEAKKFILSLDKIMLAVDRATHVVDQLTNLVKYDEGSKVPKLSLLDLRELSVQISADLVPFALEKAIDLSVADTGSMRVYGDESALGMLVRNLIDNAIRYTQFGGKVEVCFSQSVSTVSLHVTDNGPGIDDADYGKVFERFHRGEGHVLSGCGIGLAIVDEIARLHMAEINLTRPEHHSGLHVEVVFNV
ncbi:MAG: ATP-binding protein [Gammaproteobacteria bacterium]|nr:ATP-binding protein [Gammaproteobacteria bacterium]